MRRIPYEEIPPVVELWSFPAGLKPDELRFNFDPKRYLSGDPRFSSNLPANLRPGLEKSFKMTAAKGGYNGDKSTVSEINWFYSGEKDKLLITVNAGLSDFFTLRSIPEAAPGLHLQALSGLIIRKKTHIPVGISTHNVLLTSDGHVAMAVRSTALSFHPGKLSVSFEEQMDPDKDSTPFNTAYRGYREEFNTYIPLNRIALHGIAAEKAFAYTCWCFVGSAPYDAQEITEAWQQATDKGEAQAILMVPREEVLKFANPVIEPEVWKPHLKAGALPTELNLRPHDSVPWRIGLVTGEYLQG